MHLRRASNQASIVLGKELGRGGEGAVYPVVGVPGVVAKIYLKPPTSLKVEKLKSMARHASPALLRVAAWPIDALMDETGAVRGFLMPKVSAREDVHELYSPKSRRRAFPGADFRFLVRAATNIARAFAQVHSVGNVIGDVNHGNALVGRDGTVVLIDCDSFQVRDGVRVFTCDVGVPLFTPPELAGQAFRGLKRTANHDAFGLAVLLFHLLYIGRHPFAGKHAAGEMPIERAIAESRFVYGENAPRFGMTPPPGTLELGTFGDQIRLLFEVAFAPPGDAARPTATQWIDALQALEARLVACPARKSHHYVPRARPGRPDPGDGDGGCCWCALELHAGIRLFGERRESFEALSMAKLAPLWDAITAVKWPERGQSEVVPPEPALEAESDDVLGPVPRAILSWVLVFLAAGAILYQPGEHFVLGLMSLGAAIALRWKYRNPTTRSEVTRSMRKTLHAAREHLARITAEWNELVTDVRCDEMLARLDGIKQELLELPKQREQRLAALVNETVKLQRNRFLDQIRIDKAALPNVTRQEIAMLAAFDIDTAAEVLNGSLGIVGTISQRARDELLAWANACARNFQVDPTRGPDPEVVASLDGSLLKEQESLLKELSNGHSQLEALAGKLTEQYAAKQSELEAARRAIKTLQTESE